jgi:YebC/PmpR family DNA-binding regulatory protein
MAGHSHWAGIKHQKGIADQKRAKVFAKLLALVAAAARTESNPDFNPRLRTAIAKAREESVPLDTIERAITRAREGGADTEECLFEAYGPGGAALLIESITGNKNRVVQEVKKMLSDHHGKWAETGSVLWAFAQDPETRAWRAQYPLPLSSEDADLLDGLCAILLSHDDVQAVSTNGTRA